MDIGDKVVLVTGGGSGMGAATARYLSKKGAKVAILDVNLSDSNKLATEINALALQCDVTCENETEIAFAQLTKRLGPPRICINCAGIAPAKRIVGRDGPMPLADFEKTIKINLTGTFNTLRLAAAIMSKLEPIGDAQERGVIINTASIAAFEGQIGQCAYSASKGGIVAMTLPAARELAQFNIRVMTIAPGLVQTPMMASFSQEIQESLAANVPFPKRLASAQEYAMLVEHIIANPYLNGEVIRFDAALRMQAK